MSGNGLDKGLFRVMCDVLIPVGIRKQFSIEVFNYWPPNSAIVGSSNDQYSIIFEHSANLRENHLIKRNVLNHLGMDNVVKGPICKRQGKSRPADN